MIQPIQPNNPIELPAHKSWIARHFLAELLGLTLAAAALAGIFYLQTSSQSSQAEVFMPVHHKASTADWKTYTNSQFGFELKYPEKYFDLVNTEGKIGESVDLSEKNIHP